ncbi:hypothetical protein PQ472_01510 [Lacticaseibacillus pabuli]|uniref:ABC transporter permease n=1 Tax=Lacticaseibacillus pabuli TaxID=3025672 RepID=A0ABY7WRZ6_9LACO|nr:hypothetical protein [Lacticaseibacillus sp. KACC 23028]WDF82948.1 hypothetical protein PQ472_01510 [Lacticaseibacillus sp. KACC 23028]
MKQKIWVYVIAALCSVLLVWTTLGGLQPNIPSKVPEAGVSAFFALQLGASQPVWFTTVLLLLIPFTAGISIIYMKNNRAITNVVVRAKGYKRILIGTAFSSFLNGFFLQLVVNFFELVGLRVLYGPINVMSSSNYLVYDRTFNFSQNGWINLMMFLLLSGIGMGLFSASIFSLGLYIKRTFIFNLLGIVAGFGLILIPAGLSGFGSHHAGLISYAFFLPSLIAPSNMTIGVYYPSLSPYTYYIGSICVYLTTTVLLLMIALRGKDMVQRGSKNIVSSI